MKKKYELKSLIVIFLLMINIVFLLIFLCMFKPKKIEVDEQFYNIEFVIKNYKKVLNDKLSSYKGNVYEPSKWKLQQNFMYSFKDSDHNYQTSELEIEFTRLIHSENTKGIKPGFCRISCCSDLKTKRFLAFVICWTNIKKELSKEEQYIPGYGDTYVSDIGKYTDTIYSSLREEVIRERYPEFKGYFKKLFLKRIFIDGNYSIDSKDFYNHIEFDNFRFGLDYRDIIDDSEKILP